MSRSPSPSRRRRARLPALPAGDLAAACRRHRLDLGRVLQGAWALVLSHHGGGDEEVAFRFLDLATVPAPGAGAAEPQTRRLRVAGEETLLAWLSAVAPAPAEAAPAPGGGFDTVLILARRPWARPATSGLQPAGTGSGTPIAIRVEHDAAGGGRLHFSLDAFAGREAAITGIRLAHAFRALVEALPRCLDTPLPAIEVQTAAARHQALVEWNEPRPSYAAEGLLPELLARQAARLPDAVPLVCGDQCFSYRQLAIWAASLAGRLRGLGAAPEVVVGVLLERSPEAVVALLAIWQAGAAYLPLDPEQPRERIDLLLRDAWGADVEGSAHDSRPTAVRDGAASHVGAAGRGPRLVVTRAALGEKLAAGIERVWLAAPAGDPAAPAAPPATPEQAAYLIYTSGSTGSPKGIVVSHRSLANRILWIRAAELDAGDVFLHKTTLAFDVSLAEICGPLLAGGRCVITLPGKHQDPAYMADLIAREQVTVASFPPSTLNLLLDLPAAGRALGGLQKLITGGETVPPDLVRRVNAALPAALYNRYGPTEATISVVTGVCSPPAGDGDDRNDGGALVPLGRPFAQARVYVLDEHQRPRPALAAGEICIGGVCVARGYLGRPDLTAERFVPDPLGGEPGGRLYRTGDRGRWRLDGRLDFLGRNDQQVKIRGFRIELEEVEAALAAHPAVREAAVVARDETATGSRRLVAYLAPREGTATDSGELRRFLAVRLAPYMIPAAFVRVDALPRMLSGKLDRRALSATPGPAPEPGDRGAGRAAAEIEGTIAGLFAELLDVPRVGLDESLFDLGGHSLLLVHLQLRLRATLGIDVRLADIARHSSAGELARFIAGDATPEVTAAALAADAVLSPAIRPAAAPASSSRAGPAAAPTPAPRAYPAAEHPRTVLLTGATGFLGAHLAGELLAQTSARVFCLVRGEDAAAARAALDRAAARFAAWRQGDAARLTALAGNLGHPGLGLDDGTFRELAAEVDAVYHCGAQVNFAYPYEALRGANVEGTRELLRLAAAGRAKRMHYVSTLALLAPAPAAARAEEPLGDDAGGLAGGYLQSKWVAEKLVEAAGRRGLPVSIYRPGWIVASSRTGIGNPADLLHRLFLASLLHGCAPRFGAIEIYPTPVNYVAAAIVWLSLRGAPAPGIFHLINPRPLALDQVIGWLGDLGWPLAMKPPARWAADLAEKAAQDELLAPLAGFLRELAGRTAAGAAAGDPGDWQPPRFDSRRTLAALEPGPVRCPAVDLEYLKALLATAAERRLSAGG